MPVYGPWRSGAVERLRPACGLEARGKLMAEAETMIIFRGCLFDASRIGGQGHIASRLYFEVVGTSDGAHTCQVDVTQPAGLPYGQGQVEVGTPEGDTPPLDRDRFTRAAADYYRMVADEVGLQLLEPEARATRARDVIVSRTWEVRPGGA